MSSRKLTNNEPESEFSLSGYDGYLRFLAAGSTRFPLGSEYFLVISGLGKNVETVHFPVRFFSGRNTAAMFLEFFLWVPAGITLEPVGIHRK